MACHRSLSWLGGGEEQGPAVMWLLRSRTDNTDRRHTPRGFPLGQLSAKPHRLQVCLSRSLLRGLEGGTFRMNSGRRVQGPECKPRQK
jgi:hypothetical protein